MADNDVKALIDEISAVRKLMILQLLAAGVKQKHIGEMLGVSEATMSRMLPKGLAAAVARKEL